jgi:hypothetical protein
MSVFEPIEVGFWSTFPGDTRPDPAPLCSRVPARSVHPDVLAYLTTAALVESVELGFSHCRIPDCPHFNKRSAAVGCANLTDGVFLWPEGLAHYVSAHSLQLPPTFQHHIERVIELWRGKDASAEGKPDPPRTAPPAAALPRLNRFTLQPTAASTMPSASVIGDAAAPAAVAPWALEELPHGWLAHLRAVSPVLCVDTGTTPRRHGDAGSAALAGPQREGTALQEAGRFLDCALRAGGEMRARSRLGVASHAITCLGCNSSHEHTTS